MRAATRRLLLRAALLAAAAALLALSGCRQRVDWVMFRGQQGRGYTPNALRPPLGIKWKLRLQPEGEPTYAFNNPVVLGDTIYFGSTDGNFYSLDIETGYMHWVFKTRGAINSIPFADRRSVYFGNNQGKVYAVNQSDGGERWSFQTDSTVQSSIVGYDDLLLFASDGGTSYFLSPDGAERFTLPNPVWHYNTFQVYQDVVYFAPGPPARPHSLGAYDLKRRSYLWVLDTAELAATWYSFPALAGDRLYFSTAAFRGPYWEFDYYGFDRRTGERLWRYSDISRWRFTDERDSRDMFMQNLKLLDYMAPSLWRNLVIYTSGDTVVRAFHARSGTLAWSHNFDTPTSSAPTVAGNRVYVGLRGDQRSGTSARLVCLSARNGRLLWQMDVEGALLSAPVIAGRWMIFGTEENVFYVLEELY